MGRRFLYRRPRSFNIAARNLCASIIRDSVSRAAPSAASPFWPLQVAFWGAPFWHQGHPGGPWEQQDGHKVVQNRISIDLVMIWNPCIIILLGFWVQEV